MEPQESPHEHEVRGPAWPDVGLVTADPAPGPPSPPYGPRFAWRARALWLLVAIAQVVLAIVVVWTATRGGLIGVGPWMAAALLAVLAATFLRTRQAVGRGERWAAAPSQALACGLIIGGIVRFIVSMSQSSVTVPFEPLLGIWAVSAADAPTTRVAWPSDRRTAVVAALVIAMALTSVFPAIPDSTPGLAVFGSGPDTLALTIQPQCGIPGSGWDRVPIDVTWTLRGLDVFGSARDSVTISAKSSSSNVQVDTTDYSFHLFGDTRLPDYDTVIVSLPPGTRTGGYSVIAVQVLDPVPASLTITVTYRHGDRWVVEQTAACPA